MNAALESPALFGLDEALLAAAVTVTQAQGRSTLEFLEERSGLGPVELTAALARTLDYRVLTRTDLARTDPAFDLLPSAEATRRSCLLVRQGSKLLAVIADQVDEYAHHGYAVAAVGMRRKADDRAGDGLHWRELSRLLRRREYRKCPR